MPIAYPPHSMKNGELGLIEQIQKTFRIHHRSTIALGIGDDCAILRPPSGHELLVTTDFTLENRHFRRDLHPAASVGHRCLARGLSDLAAMGAKPHAAFLSLALPAEFPGKPAGKRWITQFLAGFRALADLHSVSLAGGDTAQSPTDTILADIILIGSAATGTSIRRSTARIGDHIYVSGRLGGSAADLRMLLSGKRLREQKNSPHFYPQPRLKLGSLLRERHLANSAIDLSDGLSTDLTHLCEASRVRAEINADALPIHTSAARLTPTEAFSLAVDGGEDYELLFTSPSAKLRSLAGVTLTRIGTVLKSSRTKPLITVTGSGKADRPLAPGGWEHFDR